MAELPDFHPLTVVRNWGNGQAFRISDAVTGVVAFGATGSGKTSGIAKHLALGYLANDFGGLVLCAKKEERRQWEEWAKATQRTEDLIIFDKSAKWRFNFLEWEAARAGEGAGLTINIVALLDEIAGNIAGDAGSAEGGGDSRFFRDALHHMNLNAVELTLFSGYEVSLPFMDGVVSTAPNSSAEIATEQWQQSSTCAGVIQEARARLQKADEDTLRDLDACVNYWLRDFARLSDRTRSIIVLMFSMLARPFTTRPLRQLFSTDTNVTPEDAFKGKIIIIDLPVQEYRQAGRIATLAWKYCFQVAVMRRTPPKGGYLRPVFLWADEAQNFVSDFDAEYQAVARSAAGCTVYLTQNYESLRRVLGSEDAVNSLLGNLQNKFFCQNGSPDTNKWAAELLGERWVMVQSTNVSSGTGGRGDGGGSAGASMSEQRRYYVEPSRFTTLKRGGDVYGYQVESIVYKGGHLFEDGQPFRLLVFNQRG